MDDETAFRDVLSGEKKERKEKEHEIKKSYNEMKQEQKELAKGVVGSKKGAKPKKEKKHGALEEKEGTRGLARRIWIGICCPVIPRRTPLTMMTINNL